MFLFANGYMFFGHLGYLFHKLPLLSLCPFFSPALLSPLFFFLIWWSFTSILDIHPLCFEDVFSVSVACIFVLFIISLVIQSLNIFNLLEFMSLLLYVFLVLFKKSSLNVKLFMLYFFLKVLWFFLSYLGFNPSGIYCCDSCEVGV